MGGGDGEGGGQQERRQGSVVGVAEGDESGSAALPWRSRFPPANVTAVSCLTTASSEPFVVEVMHEWSPLGAERFLQLVKSGFMTDIALFRCVAGFICQFGISGRSQVNHMWNQERSPLQDDPNRGIPFTAGSVSFAGSSPNSRTTQMFISFGDHPHLGKAPWETPFGMVTRGYEETVKKIYTGYGEQGAKSGGVEQGLIHSEGNDYLRRDFHKLDFIRECHLVNSKAHPSHSDLADPLVASERSGFLRQPSLLAGAAFSLVLVAILFALRELATTLIRSVRASKQS
jgi:peptidyl-prolyl cis-trans isomerase A (cyclophilin A)